MWLESLGKGMGGCWRMVKDRVHGRHETGMEGAAGAVFREGGGGVVDKERAVGARLAGRGAVQVEGV